MSRISDEEVKNWLIKELQDVELEINKCMGSYKSMNDKCAVLKNILAHYEEITKPVEPTAYQKELAEKYMALPFYNEYDYYIWFEKDGVTVLVDHNDGVSIITDELIEMMKR
jgi:hypothetical protein